MPDMLRIQIDLDFHLLQLGLLLNRLLVFLLTLHLMVTITDTSDVVEYSFIGVRL